MMNHIWESTAFALIAGLLTLAFRSNRAPIRYGLWMAASLKFLVPFALLVALGNQFPWRTGQALVARAVAFQPGGGEPYDLLPGLGAVMPARGTAYPLPRALAFIWLCGFLKVTIAWFRRWREVRSAVRRAKRLAIEAAIPVLSSDARLEPGVFGILRPVLLLPEGLAGQLTPEQLDAVIAHELCHVQRRDNLTAAIHMFVEAVFWFHPLVWWIGRRMIDERERACDEAVLERKFDPEVYAEGILHVCRMHLDPALPCMSGVGGSDLTRRIEEIMNGRAIRGLTRARKILLGAAAAMVVTIPILIGLANAPLLTAQSKPAKRLAFEVISIKPNPSQDPRNFVSKTEPDGRTTLRSVPIYMVIAAAYGVPFQSPRLSGGPEWTHTEMYDIEAVPEKGAIPPDSSKDERAARGRQMMQSLLEDRFQLKIRREDKEIPVYAVVVAKGGPKLQKSAAEEKGCVDDYPRVPGAVQAPCYHFSGGQGRGIHGRAVTIAGVAQFVENWADRPVIDKSGIQGLFDIDTDGWTPMRPRQGPPRDPSRPLTPEELAASDPTTPTLFNIFDRLGLKLEPQRAPVQSFVIESIERPTAN